MSERELERRAQRRVTVLRHVKEVSGSVAATCRYTESAGSVITADCVGMRPTQPAVLIPYTSTAWGRDRPRAFL